MYSYTKKDNYNNQVASSYNFMLGHIESHALLPQGCSYTEILTMQ